MKYEEDYKRLIGEVLSEHMLDAICSYYYNLGWKAATENSQKQLRALLGLEE